MSDGRRPSIADSPVRNEKSATTRRKARSAGTVVYLESTKDSGDGPWMTVCETHGGCVHHETRKLAEQWLSHPEDSCPTCQEHKPQ